MILLTSLKLKRQRNACSLSLSLSLSIVLRCYQIFSSTLQVYFHIFFINGHGQMHSKTHRNKIIALHFKNTSLSWDMKWKKNKMKNSQEWKQKFSFLIPSHIQPKFDSILILRFSNCIGFRLSECLNKNYFWESIFIFK